MTSCLLIRRIYFQIVTSLLSGSRDCLFELARISKIFGCLQRLFYLAVQTKLVLSLTRSWNWQNSILCQGSIEWLPNIGDLSLSLDGWCPKAGPWGKLGLSEKPQCDVFWLMSNSGPWLMTMESLQSLGRGWNSILCPCWRYCCRYLGKTLRISWRETRRTVRWNHCRFYWSWCRLDSCNSRLWAGAEFIEAPPEENMSDVELVVFLHWWW